MSDAQPSERLIIDLPEWLVIEEFKPGIHLISGLNLLVSFTEDCSTVSVPVHRGEYHSWDLFRHSYEPRFVGFQFWLHYNPHRLLPAPA